jgi:putative ABC transport system ATP-binding protein
MPKRVHRASLGEAAGSPLPAIELRNVVKEYESGSHGIRALDDVSLRIAAGEIIAIHGPSGAGKTTLLHVIAGRCAPSRGAVLIFGRHIEHESAESIQRLLEGTVRTAEETEHIGSLSVLDNVVLALFTRTRCSRSITHARSRDAWEALSAVGMRRRADAVFAALSSGERQRVVIARAVVGEPRIVLVDEPGRDLDWQGAEYMVDLLVRARAISGAAIVLATHDIRTAARADRIVVLRDGALVDEIRASHIEPVEDSDGR